MKRSESTIRSPPMAIQTWDTVFVFYYSPPFFASLANLVTFEIKAKPDLHFCEKVLLHHSQVILSVKS